MAERDIVRFGVSIGSGLLEKFDALIEEKGYTNRSEAIRDLIRDRLVKDEWDGKTVSVESIGTITLIYDHHTSETGDKLTDTAHEHHDLVVSSSHVHLTHDSCLEVVIVKGPGNRILSLADRLTSMRGVKHGKLVVTGLVEDTL
ncbi:nickel-responsive transcriptional regulator NikR [Candidatus Latescibacterota bacterium]